MHAIQKGNVVFSQSADLYFHPENFFRKSFLSLMMPYRIFTGIGFVVVIDELVNDEEFFFKDKKDLANFTRQLTAADERFVRTEECFYAYVVKQNTQDPFESI
jgi:hypothetical protein